MVLYDLKSVYDFHLSPHHQNYYLIVVDKEYLNFLIDSCYKQINNYYEGATRTINDFIKTKEYSSELKLILNDIQKRKLYWENKDDKHISLDYLYFMLLNYSNNDLLKRNKLVIYYNGFN